MKINFYKMLSFSALVLLASCGAGLDQSLQGVAAIGAPLSNASIVLKDSTGLTRTTTADESGKYTFSKSDLLGLKAPVQVSATVQLGEKLVTHYAVISELKSSDVGNTANITPLTSAITGLLNSSGILTDFSPAQLTQLTPDVYANANNKVKAAIAPLSTQIVGQNFDPLTTPITQTGKTADLLLDHLDVSVRSDTVSITNKMAVLGNSDPITAATSQISKNPGTPATPIQASETTSTEGFEDLMAQFRKCFATTYSDRLSNKTKGDATLHTNCSDITVNDAQGYLHNGTNFKVRWAKALNSSTIGASAKFFMPEVRLRISKAPVERIAVNINFMDNSGSGYTVPEIIEKSDATGGKWRLRGNQRPVNALIEAQLDYYKDLSSNASFVNTNFSRIASSLRIYLDPRISFNPTTGAPDYSDAIDLTKSYGFAVSPSSSTTTLKFSEFKAALLAADSVKKNNHFIGCVVVTGPGQWSGSKWMGIYPNGIVLKLPNGSPTQDYVAIDKRLSSSELSSVVASSATSNYSNRSLVSDTVCGDGTTNQSNSNYTIELEALTNQVHPFTGNVDTSINGRDVQWNTGPSFARIAPDANLAKQFDLNPNLTMYVITDAKKVALKMDVRYLGDLPPASQARELVDKNRVSIMSTDTLKSYLDFSSNSTTVNTVTTASAKWTTAPGAFGADLIGFYAQVYKSKPGRGLRGPSSVIVTNQTATPDGIWTADEDLAAALDATGAGNALPNMNFYWSWADYARPPLSDGSCYKAGTTKPATLVTSTNAAVGRSDTSFTNRSLNGAAYHGIDALLTACLNSDSADTNRASDAYLHREVWMRTYTDRNVRVYVYTANKKYRSPS